MLKIYVRDGAIVEAAAFRTLIDILPRPVALVLDKPFKSLNTLLADANLKRDITDSVGLTNSSKVTSETAKEHAKLGPI